MKLRYIDWYDFQAICEKLGSKLIDGEYDAVIGIARGGVIPARVIADVAGISRYGAITTQHYDHDSYAQLKRVFIADFKLASDLKHVIVVDDIYDSGATLQAVAKELRKKKVNATFVTLLSKKAITEIEGFRFVYGELVKDDWVVFPWECQEIQRVVGK